MMPAIVATRSKITPEARHRMARKTRREELAEALATSRADTGRMPDYPQPEPEPPKRLT